MINNYSVWKYDSTSGFTEGSDSSEPAGLAAAQVGLHVLVATRWKLTGSSAMPGYALPGVKTSGTGVLDTSGHELLEDLTLVSCFLPGAWVSYLLLGVLILTNILAGVSNMCHLLAMTLIILGHL